MNLATGSQTVSLAESGGVSRDIRPVALIALLLIGAMLLSYGAQTLAGNFPDTDDAMRMVIVRDLLGGQDWFDLTVTRLSPPGVEMHWSRLVDLPIAGLTVVCSWFFDGAFAERVAAIIWPLALLVAGLVLVNRLATVLVGGDGSLLVLGMAAASFCIWNYFPPGRVDHHNLQLILGLGFVLSLVNVARRDEGALMAGALAALMAAVGMESLPWIVGGTAWLAMLWVIRDGRYSGSIGAFGLALGLATVLLLVATRGSDLLAERCDSLSIAHATTAVLGGAAFGGLGLLVRSGWRVRLVALAAAGVAVFVCAYALFPQCAAGPYSELPTELVARWLTGVGEARSIMQILATDLTMISQYTVAGLGFGCAVWLIFRDPARATVWSLIAAVVGVSFLAGLFQIRAVVPGTVLAALPIAAVFLALRARARSALTAALLFLAGLFAGSTMAQAMVIDAVFQSPAASDEASKPVTGPCWTPAAITRAADLPSGLALAPIDLGPSILYRTSHAVLGAPYHRNAAGNLAVLGIFADTPRVAEAAIRQRDIDYVFHCRGRPTYGGLSDQSLYVVLERGEPPAWLVPVFSDPEAGLEIFRVGPEARADAPEGGFRQFDLRGPG